MKRADHGRRRRGEGHRVHTVRDGIRYGVRSGQFCGTLNGYGTCVQTITNSLGQTIPFRNQVCAPSIKVDFCDSWGRWKS